jgi:hypothetical protein
MRLRNMFSGIAPERFLKLTEQEQRWFDNVKKAFHENDRAYAEGQLADRGLEEACKAIDTAKTLRRSLRGEDTSTAHNKAKFVEFLNLEVPDAASGGMQVQLVDSRDGRRKTYSFADLVYAIRCMIHEGENLNAAEKVDYHILLDWSDPHSAYWGKVSDGRLVLNGHRVWERVREILSKFVTGIIGMIAHAKGEPFSVTIQPPLGSVRPVR